MGLLHEVTKLPPLSGNSITTDDIKKNSNKQLSDIKTNLLLLKKEYR